MGERGLRADILMVTVESSERYSNGVFISFGQGVTVHPCLTKATPNAAWYSSVWLNPATNPSPGILRVAASTIRTTTPRFDLPCSTGCWAEPVPEVR